jgi:hypothetical protein
MAGVQNTVSPSYGSEATRNGDLLAEFGPGFVAWECAGWLAGESQRLAGLLRLIVANETPESWRFADRRLVAVRARSYWCAARAAAAAASKGEAAEFEAHPDHGA